MSVMATFAPSRAYRNAVALPIPKAAHVINAVLLWTLFMLLP